MIDRVGKASLLALAVSIGAGCGGGGASVPLDTACADLAASRCKMQQSCDPRGFELVFADLATCTARLQLTCPIVAAAPGSGYTGNSIEACARAMAATSCVNFMNNLGPGACRIRGTLPLGAGCIDDAQCAGADNYCLINNGACGQCTARKPISDFGTCGDNAGCLDGLICSLTMCAQPLSADAACDLTHPCGWPYTCVGAVCSLPTLGEGAPCDVNEQACNRDQRLVCYEADVDVCTVWPVGHMGEACGLMGNIVGLCLDGLICNIVSGDLGTCDPPLADGAACPTPDFFFDRCQPPATCTGNVCRLPDPSTCGSADAGTD